MNEFRRPAAKQFMKRVGPASPGEPAGGLTVRSLNFEFLRPEWPELASLAGFAEQYAHTDPAGALVKLRTFVEEVVELVYQKFNLPRPPQPSLMELLSEPTFAQSIPRVVINTIDAIRIHGNKAAHGVAGTTNTVLWLLKEAHRLGKWLYLTFTASAKPSAIAEYLDPTPELVNGKSKSELKREKAAILQRLAGQEAQMQKLLADLAAARQEAANLKASAEELQARLQAAQHAVSVLDFNEEETRLLLIDTQVTAAGLDVGAGKKSTDSVGKEVPVHYQPNESGEGQADYVLWDDEKTLPLAVIEAKKTAIDPDAGRTAAKDYADGLAKEYGQRPVIFYTNGFDTWIWDDAEHWPPRKVYGFYSKDSLQYHIRRRTQQQELSKIIPHKDIAGRLYQIEAVTRVLERFQNRRRKALLVQATGTGKTRVAISISEALLRAGWVKRILFLSDRRELRKQANNAYKKYLPDLPRIYVTAQTHQERENRVYLATYPAMMKCFETFDPGFFDLIVADESHRSIYNRYRDLFKYFDALQVAHGAD
jgi:type I restriction enzyme, R subunit